MNTGDDALTVDEHGKPVPLRGGEHGKVLYRGPTTVCAAGTTPEWGFGFRAFPFAGLVQRRFCMRLYAGGAVEAVSRMGSLWKGNHPLAKMHTWPSPTSTRATFSRPVPFQMGGDCLGERDVIDYNLAARHGRRPRLGTASCQGYGRASGPKPRPRPRRRTVERKRVTGAELRAPRGSLNAQSRAPRPRAHCARGAMRTRA